MRYLWNKCGYQILSKSMQAFLSYRMETKKLTDGGDTIIRPADDGRIKRCLQILLYATIILHKSTLLIHQYLIYTINTLDFHCFLIDLNPHFNAKLLWISPWSFKARINICKPRFHASWVRESGDSRHSIGRWDLNPYKNLGSKDLARLIRFRGLSARGLTALHCIYLYNKT